VIIEEHILNNLNRIISDGQRLRQSNQYGQVTSPVQKQECSGWIASALHIIELITSNKTNDYYLHSKKIADKEYGYIINQQVGELTYLLEYLKNDIKEGLLTSIAERARAETFDNFLDHAQKYYDNNQKNESGVISGVVFEDTIRRICAKNSIPENGIKLDKLINDLSAANIISQVKAKRARVAAHVRTKATHAQWDEFDLAEVEETIKITREFIEKYLE